MDGDLLSSSAITHFLASSDFAHPGIYEFRAHILTATAEEEVEEEEEEDWRRPRRGGEVRGEGGRRAKDADAADRQSRTEQHRWK